MLLENESYPNDNRVANQAKTLLAAGYQITVVCPSIRGDASRKVIDGVTVYRFRLPETGNGVAGFVWEYTYAMAASLALSLKVLRHEGFDVIHAHNPPDTFVLIAALYRPFGKRFIFDHHDLCPEMYEARSGTKNRPIQQALLFFERLSCRLADHVIATNQSYRAIEIQRCGVPEDRITVVRNGPDLDRIRAVPPDPELQKKAPTLIGYVGVMGPQDGVDYLLRALKYLAFDLDRKNDFFAVVVGTGEAWPALRRLITELGLENHVWMTGSIPDEELVRYLSTADICVVPDPANPFTERSTMVKVMEYMALGKPIVAFDLPEHRVSAGEAALYAPPNDELEFARTISSLMDDRELRERMGAVGRRRVETELAWEHSAPHLLEAYRIALGKPEAQSAGPNDP